MYIATFPRYAPAQLICSQRGRPGTEAKTCILCYIVTKYVYMTYERIELIMDTIVLLYVGVAREHNGGAQSFKLYVARRKG